MSVLLKEIARRYNSEAQTLTQAGFCTDSDIQSLTREDLKELFPGVGNFKLRRSIFEIIHTQRPIDVVLNEMKAFIPRESFSAALTDKGVLVEYLSILKDIKSQVDNVQAFLHAHVDLLEKIRRNEEDFKPTGGPVINPQNVQNPQRPHGSSVDASYSRQMMSHAHPPVRSAVSQQQTQATVKYKQEVTGTTFDAHVQLLQKVSTHSLSLEESHQDYQVTFVFCPITSRVGTDVAAAMHTFSGEEHVILVIMHHTRDAKTITLKTFADYPNVRLHVSVFYHDTMRGLLDCQQNNDAVSEIQELLQQYINKDTSENAPGVAARPDGTEVCGGGGNYRVSGVDDSSRMFGRFTSKFW